MWQTHFSVFLGNLGGPKSNAICHNTNLCRKPGPQQYLMKQEVSHHNWLGSTCSCQLQLSAFPKTDLKNHSNRGFDEVTSIVRQKRGWLVDHTQPYTAGAPSRRKRFCMRFVDPIPGPPWNSIDTARQRANAVWCWKILLLPLAPNINVAKTCNLTRHLTFQALCPRGTSWKPPKTT